MGILGQDLRYAVRIFAKSPGFSAVAVLTLALGIGANSAIFAVVDRVLIRPLPVRRPDRLVLLRSPGPSQGNTWSDNDEATSFSYPMYRALAERATVFEGLIGELPFQASIATRGGTETSAGELVTGNYFAVLGVLPTLGRVLTPADDRSPGGHPLVVLSHACWRRRFGGDPSIVGQTLRINDHLLTIVGVAAASFDGIQAGRRADLFVPMMMKAQMTPGWNGLDDPKSYWLQMVGRLKPGLSLPAAQRALAPTYRALLEEALPRITGWSDVRRQEFLNRRLELQPSARGRRVLQDGIGTPLLFGGPGTKPDTEIVGVVADSKGAEVSEEPTPYAYLSFNQPARLVDVTFYARTEQDPATLAPAIRETVHRRDPQLPIDDLKTLTAQVEDSLLTERLMMLLSVAFGCLAALLAALGVYGVLSFAVAARRQEIGVRMALGADPAAVRRFVLGDVGRFLLVGTAIGLPCAYALARAVESLLFGVRASDPSIFAAGVGLMAAVAIAAAWPPTARAGRTDALDALRSE